MDSISTSDPWSLVIPLVVLLVAAASAALPISALKHWRGSWKYGALLPFFVLAAWILLIVVSRLIWPGSHQLWPFEIFAWAILNMLYMVTMMQAKRKFEKEDLK